MKNKKILLALAAAGLVATGGYGLYRLGVNRGMTKHYQERAKFSLARSYFQVVLKQDPILPQHLKTTEDVAASLFGIEKEPDESDKDFLNRLAKRFEISLPKELHFEEERSPG